MSSSSLSNPGRCNSRAKPEARSVKALIVSQEKILFQLRDSDDGILFPSHWGLFGGEVELGEKPHEALERELAINECTVRPKFMWLSPENGCILHFFMVRTGLPITSLELREGQDMNFLSLREVTNRRVTPDILANQNRIRDCLSKSGDSFRYS